MSIVFGLHEGPGASGFDLMAEGLCTLRNNELPAAGDRACRCWAARTLVAPADAPSSPDLRLRKRPSSGADQLRAYSSIRDATSCSTCARAIVVILALSERCFQVVDFVSGP